MNNFGKKLREIRTSKKVRLKPIADLLGFTVSYISDIECGKRSPLKEKHIYKISEFLQIDPSVLLTELFTNNDTFQVKFNNKSDLEIETAKKLIQNWSKYSDVSFKDLLNYLDQITNVS